MSVDRFRTGSLTDSRILRIIEAALVGADPTVLVTRYLATNPLPPHARCFVLGLGKASERMMRAIALLCPRFDAALLITKRAQFRFDSRVTVLEAGHPIPDRRSVAAGEAALEFVTNMHADDLLICLISGGGSALAVAPVDGISLEDLRTLTSNVLASGATIQELNALRRTLDRIKGGGLAAATIAQVLGLILSDVIGDSIEAVASGPSAFPSPDISNVLPLPEGLPPHIVASIRHQHAVRTTHVAPDATTRIKNVVVGNAASAAQACAEQAIREGFTVEILSTGYQGEASDVGHAFGERLAAESRSRPRPFCLISTGETTVTLGANPGLGGRNQELALAAVEPLSGLENCMLISMATDGEDGPTDAAGAIVTGTTGARAQTRGLGTAEYLSRHDSYRYFDTLGDLIKPGYTGTNVNDLVLLVSL